MKTIWRTIGGLILGGALLVPVVHAATGSADSNITTVDTRTVAITRPPQSQTVNAGANVTFNVVVAGVSPFSYQWQFNGQNISGATSPTLTLNAVTAANSGGYSVVVWNAYGSVTSATASLAVLDDGANGNKPAQVVAPFCPAPQANVDSLVLITHGWSFFYPDVSWITKMADAIRASGLPANWEVRTLDWTTVSQLPDPNTVRQLGWVGGILYASQLSQQAQWKNIHLIAHSAGAAVIDGITYAFKHSPNPPTIQETFLDPYTGNDLQGRSTYGQYANWADDYFAFDYLTDYGGVIYGLLLDQVQAPGSTSGKLDWAYNVDVGGTLQTSTGVPFFVGNGVAGSTPAYVATSPSPSHGTPIDFYMSTISNTAPTCASGYGFPLSLNTAVREIGQAILEAIRRFRSVPQLLSHKTSNPFIRIRQLISP